MNTKANKEFFLLNPDYLNKETLMASYEAASRGCKVLMTGKMYLTSIPPAPNHELGWELLEYKFIGIRLESSNSEN